MKSIVWFALAYIAADTRGISGIDQEDGHLKTDEIIRKYKYPVESHYVTTEDGYILLLHRIPNPGRKPFLLQHGLQDSSAAYILRGHDKSLGYYLYDLGYDVWLGNYRGNRYSRNHTNLDPDTDYSYWDFSWHEMGMYDIPAMIDYILNQTNFLKLFYVGHSQGTTGFFVMCSERPEYNAKIEHMHALAPVAFMKHMKSPLRDTLSNLFTMGVSKNFPEVAPNTKELETICLANRRTKSVCIETVFLFMGKDYDQFNVSLYPVFMRHVPAGSSTNQIRHYMQLYKSNKFGQYDYGEDGNLKKYGKKEPPNYNLRKCNAPIILHYSRNDFMADPVDVERLAKELRNVVGKNTNFPPNWNHIDFLWANDVRKLLYQNLAKMTKEREDRM